MTIYTPIPPTYLYIKQHSITGLKYFGKTTKKDPYKYQGSGKHWSKHIKKHGKEHVVTLWVSELYHDTSISDYALQFSLENNIVESSAWANLKPENGLDGAITGVKQSVEAKANISAGLTGKKQPKISAAKIGKKQPKISAAKTGKKQPKISAAKIGKKQPKISAALTGKKQPNVSATMTGIKHLIITCPHCHVSGGERAMKRYHFDNCKHLKCIIPI